MRETEGQFAKFVEIVGKLRAPDGCPWDRAQTHESLRSCLIEEAYETVEAINRRDMGNLCEELGDVLLQVVLHAQIAGEEGAFSIQDVVRGISEKMVRRHPHVFGTEEEKRNPPGWEEMKRREKAASGGSASGGVLDGIPQAFPALLRAEKVLKRLEKAGIWPTGQEGDIPCGGEALERFGEEGKSCLEEMLRCASRLRALGFQPEQALQDYLDTVAQTCNFEGKNLDKPR